MRKLKLLFILMGIFAMCSQSFAAQNPEMDLDNVKTAIGYDPVSPETALISPTGAHLTVKQKAKVRKHAGRSIIDIILPPDSSNLQLTVPGQTIIRWSSTPAMLNLSSDLAGRRSRIEKERADLAASLLTTNARLALWQAPPKDGGAQNMSSLQEAMQQEMPRLALQQTELERRLKLVDEELSRMPKASGLGERIRVVLAGDLDEDQLVDVHYNYTHDGCGWDPIYIFNAMPDGKNTDAIGVKFLAEVWQFTGMDWKDTQITLSTRGDGPRQPAPLPEWIIDSQQKPIQPRATMLKAAQPAPLAEAANDMGVARMAPVVAATDTVYATWQLSAKGLPQGRARMQIAETTWNAPLEWLARPARNSSHVWLYANCQLPANQAWPAGQAEFNVAGQSVGNGVFTPNGAEATIYFGADPRVNVKTTTTSRKREESGIISPSKNWTYSWVYTITNGHDKPVKVKVERPAPQIVDAGVTVTNRNKPEATLDGNDHMYYWLMDVPAHGEVSIDHSLTISSPTKLPLLPDIP